MKRKPYRVVLYILLRLAELFILLMPYKAAQAIGAALGGFSHCFLKKYRDIALDNLRQAFGSEKTEAELRVICKEVFVNFGMSAVEILSMRKMNKRSMHKFAKFVNRQALDEALAAGKGVIVLGSHFCNWELGPLFTSLNGYSLTVIGRRVYYRRYNDFIVSIRASKGVETLYRDDKQVLKKSLQALKRGRILGIVPDQDVKSVDGVFVDFFGRPAYTPTGPAKIGLFTGAPVLMYHSIRENGIMKIVFGEPFYMRRTGDNERDVLENTQKWSRDLEDIIRRYPSYWAWIHKRWKTQKT